MLLRIAIAAFVAAICKLSAAAAQAIGAYDAYYGVLLGQFANSEFSEATGTVYAVNDSALQIVNFTWAGTVRDTFFWLDANFRPTKDGIRLSTFEYGNSPIGAYGALSNTVEGTSATRTVLILPTDRKISEFKSLSLFSLEDNISYGTVKIPENTVAPRTQILPDELQGSRYRISGVVQVIDTRTIRVIGFSFEGNKAPDGYFFVGQGLNVSRDSGAKAAIRGRDSFDMILPMNERYTGGRDVYVELPVGYDIQHIDFLAIYSIRFDVVYANILLKNISRYSIPPHIPPQKSYESSLMADEAWNLSNLLGTAAQRNFTFQLGPRGGRRGYQAMHRVARPPPYVWYVNGYMANLYLKRGETYNFIVEGGRNATMGEFNNPLYLTNDSYGGFTKLSNTERQAVKIYAPEDPPAMASGALCRWISAASQSPSSPPSSDASAAARRAKLADVELDESDAYATFADFRATLKLVCEGESGGAAVFKFTPGAHTPDQLFFESYNNYQMGSRIFVVDEFPADLKHIVEEPFQYEAWRHQNNLELAREGGASAASAYGSRRVGGVSRALISGLFVIVFSTVLLF